MKTKIFLTAVILLLGLTNLSLSKIITDGGGKTHMSAVHTDDISPSDQFRADMRELWEDHIVWTRNVILNLVDGLPGTDQAVNRLLQNQEDLGNAIKPFYGDEAGEKLTGLLKPHITIAAEVVTAAKQGNNAAFEEANKKWHQNAKEIAGFLSTANPNWEKSDLESMMNDHLKYTTDEASARIKKDYDADIAAYDKVHEEILEMSDMLADGIIKQFPDKFSEKLTNE
jgi:hypothetical protein